MKVYLGPYCDSGEDSDREVSIEIHEYDSWNADHTLALIILPILKQLKATKHGSPFVNDEDVSDELKGASTFEEADKDDSDLIHHKWEWVIDEMIFAMDKIANPNWENHYLVTDEHIQREYLAVQKRIDNGCRLFGEYFQNLWD